MYRIIRDIRSIFIIALVINSSVTYGAVRPVPRDKDETLITRRTTIGGFLGPAIKFSTVHDEFAVFVGGLGGIIINRSFVIGLAGYGLVNEIEVGTLGNQLLNFGYAGLLLGYVNRSHKIVHFSVHSLIGGGGLCYRTCFYDDCYDDVLFVFEPGIDVMLNVTKNFRIGIGGSYRFAHGVEFDELMSDDISGPAGSLIFKFGKF